MRSYMGIWLEINSAIQPFVSYKESLEKLAQYPPGFGYVFALNYVDADIKNGGISQLYANSTWPLIFYAACGAKALGLIELSQSLKEIIYHYHQKGRSRLKRQISPEYFSDIDNSWNKSIGELEDGFYRAYGKEPGSHWYRNLEDILSPIIKDHEHLFEMRT